MNEKTTEPQMVYLIDGSAYIYRAYHAISSLSTKNGLPTNAVLGFTNILLRVIRERQAKYLAVAFDARGKNFRHQLFSQYKENRPPMPEDLAAQLPYIKKVVEAHNIMALEQQGVEADDLIASAALRLSAQGYAVIIVSGDKDLLQLIGDKVQMWDPMNDRWYDRQAVQKKYNVPVDHLLDYFSLTGDSSDNVPGVVGIGAKTAEKLISEYRSLEKLYASVETLRKGKIKERILDGREKAFLSRRLIALKTDCPIPAALAAYEVPAPDVETLRRLYRELEFNRLLREELPAQSLDASRFSLVQSEKEFQSLLDSYQKAPYLAIDLETSSLDPLDAELVGIALSAGRDGAGYLPVGHRDEEGELVAGQLDMAMVLKALSPLLTDNKFPKVGHNIKFDFSVLKQHGLTMQGPLWDTMIGSYLIDPSRRSHKLDTLSEEFLERRLTSFEAVTSNDKRTDAFVYVGLEKAKDYSCEDAYATCLLWEYLLPQLKELGLWELFADLETRLIPVLAEMEMTGILVNGEELKALSEDFSSQLKKLEKKIYQLAGGEFNINSPRQLGEILFERLKLPLGRKTKTGYSTDIKVLEKLTRYHELPVEIMAHRTLTKLKTTYVDKLQEQIHPRTKRIHTSFNQTVTATGRLSSSNPNLQNIPIRTEEGMKIRHAFVAPAGSRFLAADYSQIDLRVLAHYSQDEALIEAFNKGEDIHCRTAAEIFWVNPALVTKSMRRVAKTINFGMVYGMSAFGLSSQLNLSRKDASTFIERYFTHYRGVKKFMEEIVRQARKDGYVSTLLNRRRMLPDISSANRVKREFAERTAINTPIQGTAADIIKLATLSVDSFLRNHNLQGKIVLQIHDELVLEVPEQEIEQTEKGVKKAMESVMKLLVPLEVNIAIGRNLAEV